MIQKPEEQTKSGVGILDVVMYPLQIVGAIVFILLLKRFTPFPIWACAIIGMPLFFAVFWGLLYLFCEFFDGNGSNSDKPEQ